ncbi:DNA polymerase epsilon subunit 3 [Fukomys damarensis]|uniref:DNA polymerase epsilon subunit 3 n=1 Tax=Fukomys damarensis TaxID=885580 RepID=A0A091DHM0_FUKDA|nr:DNA polymerase epsilon subunit 3 [Fukomys damarensis]
MGSLLARHLEDVGMGTRVRQDTRGTVGHSVGNLGQDGCLKGSNLSSVGSLDKSHANNFTLKGRRKDASDVLSSIQEMEFQGFIAPLKEALEACRQEQKGKKEASEQKKTRPKKKQIQRSKTGAGMRMMMKMKRGWKKMNRMKRRK